MREVPGDPVFDISIEYEAATLAALAVLDRGTRQEMAKAFVRYAASLEGIKSLSREDYFYSGIMLTCRNRMPPMAWRRIIDAMETYEKQHLAA